MNDSQSDPPAPEVPQVPSHDIPDVVPSPTKPDGVPDIGPSPDLPVPPNYPAPSDEPSKESG
jgi:hypothetical protein